MAISPMMTENIIEDFKQEISGKSQLELIALREQLQAKSDEIKRKIRSGLTISNIPKMKVSVLDELIVSDNNLLKKAATTDKNKTFLILGSGLIAATLVVAAILYFKNKT